MAEQQDLDRRAEWEALYASGAGEMFDYNIMATVVTKPVLEKATGGKASADFFVPLCGKAPDMTWLLAQGHRVTGVEWSEEAIKQFFEGNKLEYVKESDVNVGGGKAVVYRGKESPITIYCCDFLIVNGDAIGQHDCIWDSGAICAIHHSKRAAYATAIHGLLRPGGKYLLSVFSYEEPADKAEGHDHHAITPSMVDAMFGDKFTIELAQKGDRDLMMKMFSEPEPGHDSHDDHDHHGDHSGDHEAGHGSDDFSDWEWNIHLLTPKAT